MSEVENLMIESYCREWGILSKQDVRKKPDIVWPKKPSNKLESKGWTPSYDGEEPPF